MLQDATDSEEWKMRIWCYLILRDSWTDVDTMLDPTDSCSHTMLMKTASLAVQSGKHSSDTFSRWIYEQFQHYLIICFVFFGVVHYHSTQKIVGVPFNFQLKFYGCIFLKIEKTFHDIVALKGVF